MTRPRSPTWLALALALPLLAGCADRPKVILRFAGEPQDALVTIDDRYVGLLGRLQRSGVRIEPGSYRISIEQVGYFPHDVIVDVAAEGGTVVKVKLTPIRD
jgi:hypothetical protein